MASELFTTLRETFAALAKADPRCSRFGASQHRYALAPVLDAAVAIALPEELRAYATTVAGGGIGPYYGLWIAPPIEAARGVKAWTRAQPIAHLGCGYAAVIPLDGEAKDQVWIDARPVGLVAPMYSSFTAYYVDWIDRLANAVMPEAFVPPGACAFASALGGFFAMREQHLGLAAGELDGPQLTDAVASLGPGSIAIANEGPLFGANELVAPCVRCTQLMDHLGLPRSVLRT